MSSFEDPPLFLFINNRSEFEVEFLDYSTFYAILNISIPVTSSAINYAWEGISVKRGLE